MCQCSLRVAIMCLRFKECVDECWDSWTSILALVGGVRLPCVQELVKVVKHCVESMLPCMPCRGSYAFVSDLKLVRRN
jgi:hypothetical protein